MKITAFNGAMRGKKSISHFLVDEFLQGAKEGGAEVEEVFLKGKKIRHCLGCLSCWVKTPGKCIQKDDMAGILEKYLEADIMIPASPVYVENVTGMMKDFFDRLIPCMDPRFEEGENGETRHVKKLDKYPDIFVISPCGYPERSAFQVVELLFKRTAQSMNVKYLGGVYRSQAGFLMAGHPALESMVAEYMALVREAGRQLAQSGRVSDETTQALDRQLIPTDIYNQQVNQIWDGMMAKIES